MSRYAQVDRSMWGDEKFRALSGPKPNAQTLFVWLLTSPEVSPIPGLLRMGVAGISEAIEWPIASTRRFLDELSKSGMVKFDAKARLLWLPNALKRNAPRSPDNMKPWDKAWEELPECALKAEAWESMYAYFQERGGSVLQAFETKCPHPYVTLRVPPKVDPKGSDTQTDGAYPKGGPPNPDPDPDPNLSPDLDPKAEPPAGESEPAAPDVGECPTEAEMFRAYAAGLSRATGTLANVSRSEANAYALSTIWGTIASPAGQTAADFLAYLPGRVADYVEDCRARGQNQRFEGGYSPKRFLDWLLATKDGSDPFPLAPLAPDGSKARQGGKAARESGVASRWEDPTPEEIAKAVGGRP